jgi:hypothetical protein
MGKVGETVGTLDRLLSLLDRLGLWGPAGALLLPGAIGWVWSAMTSLPGPVIALCGLFGAAGGLWLYNGLYDLQQRRKVAQGQPNYEPWDHVQKLTFQQACNLWAELEPSSALPKAAYPYLRILKEQARAKDGMAAEGLNADNDYHLGSMVTRSELRKLVERLGMKKPKFLYAEKR